MNRPAALRQFIAICGGACIAKGSVYEEPLRDDPKPVAYVMGQCDYIASLLRSSLGPIECPFVPDTREAKEWADGKLHERRIERVVVEAYMGTRSLRHD